MGEFKMFLVGRASRTFSGLDMGWHRDVEGKPIFVADKKPGHKQP